MAMTKAMVSIIPHKDYENNLLCGLSSFSIAISHSNLIHQPNCLKNYKSALTISYFSEQFSILLRRESELLIHDYFL